MSNLATDKTTKEEFKEVYKTYPDTQPDGFLPFHSSRVNPIFWDIPDNSSVLDLGCNSGAFMQKLIQGKKGVKVKGLDVSENVVKLAQDKGLDVILGDAENLPFEDESFDYVVLMEVLVHVHDPKKMLSEIKRVLKKDGVLIGSAPHKNLEMNIWDDKRLHHAYYDTNGIYALLKEFFFDVHLKILKGGQFSMGMAGTYLGDKDVEILFKCGSEAMKPWDYRLSEKGYLRVWMGPTQTPGDVYYRMTGYADKMSQMNKCDVLYSHFDEKDDSAPGIWQQSVRRGPDGKPSNMIVFNQLENMLKIADMSVWQLASSWDVLAFFYAVKHVLKEKAFITEIDDWVFDVPAYNLASHPYKPGSDLEKVAHAQIELSDAIIVSTNFIRDGIRKIFPKKKIYVVPNSIDFDVWDKVKPLPLINKKEGMIRIGYTGSGNHGGDLELIKEPLLAILDEFPNVEFLAPGEMSKGLRGEGVLIRHERSYVASRWSTISQWPAACKGWQMDIGIAPLRDSNFNRAKSNLRWLEYSALSIPTVASKVYPFESIKDGKTGFICNSKQAWYDTLRDLIKDSEKRSKIGLEAYKTVKARYSMDQVAKTYKSILGALK